jgi:hypothetical protein
MQYSFDFRVMGLPKVALKQRFTNHKKLGYKYFIFNSTHLLAFSAIVKLA